MPSGLGSLTYDEAIGHYPNQYFTAAFIGSTAEHRRATIKERGDPEDRVFNFRMPILESKILKSADNLELILPIGCVPETGPYRLCVFPKHVVGPMQLLSSFKLGKPYYFDKKGGGGDADGDADGAADGAPSGQGDGEDGEGRRLMESYIGSRHASTLLCSSACTLL